MTRRKRLLVGLLGLAVVISAIPAAGAVRWRWLTAELRADLEAARQPLDPAGIALPTTAEVPPPVARYLAAVLTPGQRRIAAVQVRHVGDFDLGEHEPNWTTFKSDQRVTTSRPGFDWNARVRMSSLLDVRVHDAYVAGEGILTAAVLGLVPVVTMRGTPEVARGELMRWLAEAVWYPTALLPGAGLRWEAVDERTAVARLRDGGTEVALTFHFGADGMVERVTAEDRERVVDGRSTPTPWQATVGEWVESNGMRIPLEGEVAWILDGRPRVYWRGRIMDLAYEWAPLRP